MRCVFSSIRQCNKFTLCLSLKMRVQCIQVCLTVYSYRWMTFTGTSFAVVTDRLVKPNFVFFKEKGSCENKSYRQLKHASFSFYVRNGSRFQMNIERGRGKMDAKLVAYLFLSCRYCLGIFYFFKKTLQKSARVMTYRTKLSTLPLVSYTSALQIFQ